MKSVLLVVIDALTSAVIGPAMEQGRLPTLQALAERGQVRFDCRSIFPSITPAATSSIITGRYPCDHGIAGASWYDEERDDVAYYGDDFWTILKEGTGRFFQDFLVHLNGSRLKALTLFQTVERAGHSAACLNYLVYRGDTTHKLHVPLLLGLLPGVPFTEHVEGPSTLCLGDFVAQSPGRPALHSVGGMRHRYGMDDAGTAGYLASLASVGRMPDLTVAYFADNDFEGHRVGPADAVPVVEKVDASLRDLFDALGGLDAALESLCIVITGDHSHADNSADEARATVDLDTALAQLQLANPGRGWAGSEDVMVCPNMRAAQVYCRQPSRALIQSIVEQLLAEPRVDQVMWHGSVLDPHDTTFHVATADRGHLQFTMTDREPSTLDEYGGRWAWSGDLAAVGGRIDERGRLVSDDYPNPFERLAGGLRHPHAGHLWATARPGSEFLAPGGGVHVGGASHGALHAQDSILPLFTAGWPTPIEWTAPPRTVDVAALCLTALGLVPSRAAGESHAAAWAQAR